MTSKRFLGLILSLVMLLSCLGVTAVADEVRDIELTGETNKYGWEIPVETLKFSYYSCDDDATNQKEEDERLAEVDKVLKDEFNIEIEKLIYAQDSTERLNLMLAANDYPEVIVGMSDAMANTFIEQGRAIELTPYLEKYGQNVLASYGPYINMLKEDDGSLYKLSSCIGNTTDVMGRDFEIRWDLFEKNYGVRTCVIMGNLSEMGIPVVCETDIHGVIGAAMATAVARGDSCIFLADITQRHPTNENAELLWHCGPFPRALAKESSHPSLVSWHGQWELMEGDITLCRFDMVETGKYALFADHCHTTEGPVTHGTYVWVEVDDWIKWERKFVEGPYIHHVAGIYGKYAPILKEACKYLNGVVYDCADREIF